MPFGGVKGMDTVSGDVIMSVLFLPHPDSSKKALTLTGKNMFPFGANSFLIEHTSFRKRTGV